MPRLIFLALMMCIFTPLTTSAQDLFFETLAKNAQANRAAKANQEAANIQKRIERLQKSMRKQLQLQKVYVGQVISVSHGNRFKIKLSTTMPLPYGGRVYEVTLYGIEVPKDVDNTDSKEAFKKADSRQEMQADRVYETV